MRLRLELPHPLIFLLAGVAIATLLTWILPAWGSRLAAVLGIGGMLLMTGT
jgi:hypothetical protein